jgi:hypothetical protein
MEKMKTINFKGFKIYSILHNNGTTECHAFKNEKPIFGTFADKDKKSALEKIKIKITEKQKQLKQ